MPKTLFAFLNKIKPAAIALACTAVSLAASALPASHYSESSVLASGKWAKVKVSQSGMHVITDAELRKLGFTDPAKVRVYGTGGNQLDNGLTAGNADDLPLQPSVRTRKGVAFHATDHIRWTSQPKGLPWAHSIHAYSHDNYYFITDSEADLSGIPASGATAASPEGKPVSSFIERQVHEQELEFAGHSGSQIYGEDFRAKPTQTFTFARPGAVDGRVSVKVRFAAKCVNGQSTLSFKANGKSLAKTQTDVIGKCDVGEYCTVTETEKEIDGIDGNLELSIGYSQTGVLFLARLDYIEAFYERELALEKGELHFYGDYGTGDCVQVAGCSSGTVIWDVSDPAEVRPVSFVLEGDIAKFSILSPGHHEFVAFEPETVTRSATGAGSVGNQNIHGMDIPDMVIITLPEYSEGARRIAKVHEDTDGFRVAVLDAADIYNEFSGGKPDFGAFRRMMKMWHDRGQSADSHSLRYCLLMGKPLYDNKLVTVSGRNAGFKPMPIYQSYDGLGEHFSFSNDDYIGMLDDVQPDKFSLTQARIHVAVGRLPVTSAREAAEMAAKVEKYVNAPSYGAWRNKVMIIADDEDSGVHLNQAQDVYNAMRSSGNGKSVVYDRLYLDSYPRVMTGVGATYPQATERMMRNYNDGVLYTDYIGHASPTGWGHEHLWEWNDIISMENTNLTFIYAATCGFAYWDDLSRSGAEHLLLNPESGIIGMMGATRTVYVYENGHLNNAVHRHLFERGEDGLPLRFGDVYVRGKNEYLCKNTLRYAFLGDPAIRVPSGENNVCVRTVNGIETGAGMPELPAMSTAEIEGEITDAEGNVLTGFNGTVNLQLYDAERVITTYGNGNGGKVISYNDRDKRLAATNARVTEGKWKAVLRVPPEIQGNYTPAMIACYAWAEGYGEANGICERLYVYGFNEKENTDSIGPEIESFYVNTPNFENGGLINANSIVFARLRDESGINISDSGIGYSMTLTVDGKEIYNDLNGYFTQDTGDANSGSLVYPLSGLAAGKHTLLLTVWDNANNVSKAAVEVNAGTVTDPVIHGITAGIHDTGMAFNITTDRPNTQLKCEHSIHDLNGRRLWSNEQTVSSGLNSTVTALWDLCDQGGTRVPRGIYIFRTRIETPEGTYFSKSKKIAVAAQQGQ